MTDGYRILVCGSRSFADGFTSGDHLKDHVEAKLLAATLDGLLAHSERLGVPFVLVHGAAKSGGDAVAEVWGVARGVVVERHPADWSQYGKRAGYVRNAEMVKTLDPSSVLHLVIAGWDGESSGTRHTMEAATAANVPVVVLGKFR